MTAAVAYSEDYDQPTDDFWHEAAVVGWRPICKRNHRRHLSLITANNAVKASKGKANIFTTERY